MKASLRVSNASFAAGVQDRDLGLFRKRLVRGLVMVL